MNQQIEIYQKRTVGELANQYAARNIFFDYRERKSEETIRRQKADIKLFLSYLYQCPFSDEEKEELSDLWYSPQGWSHITFGLVEGFLHWMFNNGYALGSINVRLSTIKTYCKLAAKADCISKGDYALIKTVTGYRYGEAKNVDKKRDVTRIGEKKAHFAVLSKSQYQELKNQPDTPQGRRDLFLITLLFELGLRCGEIAGLKTSELNLNEGLLVFRREKVDKTQTHELSRAILIAARKYLEVCTPGEYLMMGSSHNGSLRGRMKTRSITQRVTDLCKRIGIDGISAHDGRHTWATFAVRAGTDIKTLQDAGGWNSPYMPLRYAESQKIANKGVKLDY